MSYIMLMATAERVVDSWIRSGCVGDLAAKLKEAYDEVDYCLGYK